MKTFISPFQPPQWLGETTLQLDVSEFARKLVERWPGAALTRNMPGTRYLLMWDLTPGGLEGGLLGEGATGQFVSMDGSVAQTAEFAVWYRRYVAPEYRLFLFDESLDLTFELCVGISEAEILKAIQAE